MSAKTGYGGSLVIYDSAVPSVMLGVKGWDMDDKANVEDCTPMGSVASIVQGRKYFAVTQLEWGGSCKGYIDSGDLGFSIQGEATRPVIAAGQLGRVDFYTSPSSTSKYYGDVILQSVKPTVSVEGIINFDISYQGVGTLMYRLV